MIKIDIEERKQKIVEKYGDDPTICYYYCLYNALHYSNRRENGEQLLRESFESIEGIDGEVIVADHGSTDGTLEIVKDYDIGIINVRKDRDSPCSSTKVMNSVIHKSKSNFLVDLDVHIVYPRDFNEFCVDWIQNNDITKKLLIMSGLIRRLRTGLLARDNAIGRKPHSFARFFYKPYLIEAGGFDERTSYHFFNTNYHYFLLLDVYKLVLDNYDVDFIHSPWARSLKTDFKARIWRDTKKERIKLTEQLINGLIKDFDKGAKQIQNSYW